MAIKINGVTITSIKLNGGRVFTERLNGTAVYIDSPTTTAEWQFVTYYSSEPDNYDFFTSQYINGDYEQGLAWLDSNFREDLHEGFVAVISDLSTLNYFEYVVVAI